MSSFGKYVLDRTDDLFSIPTALEFCFPPGSGHYRPSPSQLGSGIRAIATRSLNRLHAHGVTVMACPHCHATEHPVAQHLVHSPQERTWQFGISTSAGGTRWQASTQGPWSWSTPSLNLYRPAIRSRCYAVTTRQQHRTSPQTLHNQSSHGQLTSPWLA